jgi:transposase
MEGLTTQCPTTETRGQRRRKRISIGELRRRHREEIKRLKQERKASEEALKARIVELEQELALYRDQAKGIGGTDRLDTSERGMRGRTGRPKGGKAKGTRGGRRIASNLPVQEVVVEPPAEQRICPLCDKPVRPLSGMEDGSEQIEYEVVVRRKRTRRPKYAPTCDCGDLPAIIQAPAPPRAFTRSMFSDDFWIHVVLEKYAWQIPTSVQMRRLAEMGLEVNASTLCGGIARMADFFEPLYRAIIEKNLEGDHWGSDESGLAVFEEREGRATFLHAMWQYCNQTTVVFVLRPTRGGEHPREYFGQRAGTLNVDRAPCYKTLRFMALAFCWAHVRRDFIKLGRYRAGNRTWALGYLTLIRAIFGGNRERLACQNPSPQFDQKHARLVGLVGQLEEKFRGELASENLSAPRRKILESLDRHWSGLTVFVDHPQVPMDNNQAERNFRDLARFRNNCHGVFSVRFGNIVALLFTVIATLRKCGVPLFEYFRAYLELVARHHGPPERLDGYLPWNLSAEVRRRIFNTTASDQDVVDDTS